MEPRLIRDLADLSIRRACGFGLIAVFTTMIGCSSEPYLAVRLGAFGVTVAAVILLWRGQTAPRRRYRDTEVWLMIRDTAPPLPKERLQHLISQALADSYFWHARVAAYVALAMWAVAFCIWVGKQLW
jgi:hypothetical protein